MAGQSFRNKSRANFDDHINKKPLVSSSFSSVMAKYYLPALLCIVLYSIPGQRGISGSAVNSTSSIKPPQQQQQQQQPPAALRNVSAGLQSASDQLAQEQRLALQIITTDSLDSEPQVVAQRSHHGGARSGSKLHRAASSSSRLSNSNANNKIERLSASSMDLGADSMVDNGAITFDEQLGLMDNQLRKNRESPVGGADQFASTPKRIIINLNTESSSGSNSSQPGGSKGTKITIGFADGPEEPKSEPVVAKPSQSRQRAAGSRLRAAGSESPDMGRLVEALRLQGGVPAMIVGQRGEEMFGQLGAGAKEAPRVKLMVNAELIDQVRHRQQPGSRELQQQQQQQTGQVTRPIQSSASSLANDITLREAIENLSNEINSLEKQFDQGGSASSSGSPAAAQQQQQQQQQVRRESLSKLGSSGQHSISSGDQQQPVYLIGSSDEQPSDTLGSENIQQQQNDLIEQRQNRGYPHGKHLLLSNDNAMVARDEEEDGLSEVADDSFADSNQSKLRTVQELDEAGADRSSETLAGDDSTQDQQQAPLGSSMLQQPQQQQQQSLVQVAGSDEVSTPDGNNEQGGQNYESTRTQLADKLPLEKVDPAGTNLLSPRQYYRSASLLMDNSLALAGLGSTRQMSSKPAPEGVDEGGSGELTRHGSALSAKLGLRAAKQVSLAQENSAEPMDERVARILDELKLYTTKEQLVKVVRDLLSREEAQDNEQLGSRPVEDRVASEKRSPPKLSPPNRGQRPTTMDATGSLEADIQAAAWPRQEPAQMQQQEAAVAPVRPRKSSQASAESRTKVAPQTPVYAADGGSGSPAGNRNPGAAGQSSDKESHLGAGKSIKTQPVPGSERRRWMREIDSRLLWDFRKRHSNLKAMLESSQAAASREAKSLPQAELTANTELYLTEATPVTGGTQQAAASSPHQSSSPPLQIVALSSSSGADRHVSTEEPDTQSTRDPPGQDEFTSAIEYPTPSGAAQMRQQQEAANYNPLQDQYQQQQQSDSQSPEASRSIQSYLPASGGKERRSVLEQSAAISDEESKLQLKGIAEIKAMEQIIEELVRRDAKEKAAAGAGAA